MSGIVERVPIQTIDSPCINICAIDPASQLCTGCARSLHEIAGWTSGSAEWRAKVMAALPARRQAMMG
ncbi:MAG: hypothetical protein B7Y43_10455 [Sphingomonas sp. 28-62-20]|uniref:DUF1289 domain-containing protein n=1 Tax=unclassified Sphingomonas TaxID=196159 RepID=UPI000BC5EC47|nr:DUF1289 domain-containing protein [Sphingomonas sp.]OYY77304.1 MAG: hypothetical protein B7Y43_10455 [Sphingomonas sp. 28-62-20]